jgi:asparagine synthase (glutamine-hydrolysing)
MGIPQVVDQTAGVKEEELKDLKRALSRAKEAYHLEGVCSGALASVYQRSRVEGICRELDLEAISPLWGLDPEQHLRRLVRDEFVSMMVSVSALGLDQGWLGRILDLNAVEELIRLGKKFKFNVGLEGGEGETFVLECPLFSGKIVVEESARHWNGESGYLQISEARLVPKT